MEYSSEYQKFVNSFQKQKRQKTTGALQGKQDREEMKLVQQAIKNSLIDQKNVTAALENIDEMPVFYPTEGEFNTDPIAYIEKLYHEHDAGFFGTVKIVPPKSFKPKLGFDTKSTQRLPTRYQVLQKLSQGVPFDQNYDGHSFGEF